MLNDGPHFIIAAPPQGGKTSALLTWALSLAVLNSPEHVQLVLIGPRRHSLRPLADLPHVLDHCTNDAQIKETIARLEREFERRMAAYAGASRQGEVLTRTGMLGVEPAIVVLIDDYEQAKDAFGGSRMEELVKRGGDVGLHFVLAGGEGGLTGYDPILNLVKAGKSGLHLRPMEPHSAVFSLRLPVKPGGREMPPGRGVVTCCTGKGCRRWQTGRAGLGARDRGPLRAGRYSTGHLVSRERRSSGGKRRQRLQLMKPESLSLRASSAS